MDKQPYLVDLDLLSNEIIHVKAFLKAPIAYIMMGIEVSIRAGTCTNANAYFVFES